MIHYTVANATTYTIDTAAIEQGLAQAAQLLGDIGERTISLEFVSKEEMQNLNNTLRHKNEPTDILSISTEESHVGEQIITQDRKGALSIKLEPHQPLTNNHPVLGQLVLCPEIIAEHAAEAGQPESRELEWVIEHGVLHVMGFHHPGDDH